MAYSHIAFCYILLAVYSSTGTLAYKQGNWALRSYLMKHLAMVVGGIALMYISHKLDYRYYAGISKLLMIITIPLLLYTLVFGSHINNASRWIISRDRFKLPDIRFGQAGFDHLPGTYPIAQAGKY
jgi:cell division protein FtsW (lipid II flippase)